MAQKFTVDPRLLAAVSGGTMQEDHADADADADSYVDSDDEEDPKKKRRELLDKLAAEYEESVAKAKADAESGDGCLMCGS